MKSDENEHRARGTSIGPGERGPREHRARRTSIGPGERGTQGTWGPGNIYRTRGAWDPGNIGPGEHL